MKVVTRARPVVAGLCLAILSGMERIVNAQGTGSPARQVCTADEPWDLTEDYRWRWRAYQDLDCVISTLEQALKRPAKSGKDQVTLSRDEVKQLLQLAWGARDAAQRIGR